MSVPTDEAPTEAAPEVNSGAADGLQDQVIAGLLMAGVAVFWWDSTNIAAAEARMYPRLILIIMAALSLMLFARGFRASRQGLAPQIITSVRAFVLFVGTTIVYAACVSYAGFFTSSVVYLPLVAWMLGLRRHWLNAMVTSVFLLATWLVFVALFERPLPREIFWG